MWGLLDPCWLKLKQIDIQFGAGKILKIVSAKPIDFELFQRVSAKVSRTWSLVRSSDGLKISSICSVGNLFDLDSDPNSLEWEEVFPFVHGIEFGDSPESAFVLRSMLLREGVYADAYMFRDELGNYCILLEDISEQVEVVFEQQQAKNSLKLLAADLNRDIGFQKVKYNDINFMLGHLGHEIKNPLIAAINILRSLEGSHKNSDEQSDYSQIKSARLALDLALNIDTISQGYHIVF